MKVLNGPKVPVACEEGLGTSRESGWELTPTHRDRSFTTIIENKALGLTNVGLNSSSAP